MSSNGQPIFDNDGYNDQSTPNTLRKDPTSRPPQVSSKLIKSRSGAADSEASGEVTAQQGPMSRTNRLRKALGVASSSNIVEHNQSNDLKHIGSSNRKQSGSRASPSNSPTMTKHPLPNAAEPAQSPPVSRPPALRSQSYSKRHASFDTPREVPMPSIPAGTSLIDPIALDDEDMERNQAAASWSLPRRQSQSGSRYVDASRRPTAQPSPSFHAAPSAPDSSARDGMYINLTTDARGQLPHLSRNNSAPTPPYSPSAERVDLRCPQNTNENGTPDSETSSGQSGSGSEQISPAPDSANEEPTRSGYLYTGALVQTAAETRECVNNPRNRTKTVLEEDRSSTVSLPLPRSYGAERVSRLPPPARSAPKSRENSGSGSGSDSGQQAKTPTNFATTSNVTLGESHFANASTAGSIPYRTSYPSAGPFARHIPLLPGRDGSSLIAKAEMNAQPGTAWRSSGPFMRRDYGEDDSEEKSAISRGQSPKQPQIEDPITPLHPLLESSTLATPSASVRAFNFGPSSTTATPGHEQASSDPRISESLATLATREGDAKGSPAPSADRTSTASGSSGASSDVATFSERLMSDLDRSGSSFVQPKRRDSVMPSSENNANSGQAREELQRSRSRPRTEPVPPMSTSGPTMTVDTTPSAYILEASLPGYQRDEITLSTRKKRILHVVADGFVSGGGGHFERRVSFGYDADMTRIRAEFNGSTLRITVPRRPTPQTFAASLGASATAGGSSSSGLAGSGMFGRGRSNML